LFFAACWQGMWLGEAGGGLGQVVGKIRVGLPKIKWPCPPWDFSPMILSPRGGSSRGSAWAPPHLRRKSPGRIAIVSGIQKWVGDNHDIHQTKVLALP
jgi:hypothetical protein